MNLKRLKCLFVITTAAFIFSIQGCRKHPIISEVSAVKFMLEYSIDEEKFHTDSIRYMNDAGNQYSITRLEYYISNLTFHKSNGTQFTTNHVFYINAEDPDKNEILIDSIPSELYSGISFNIGLPDEYNKTNYLPATLENLNMAWPEPMGGGYHFLKLEGHFRDADKTSGYAVHLGTNNMLVKVQLDQPILLRYNNNQIQLMMNINEWFRNPNQYDLTKDGNYTMQNMALMKKISENGSSVFSIGK